MLAKPNHNPVEGFGIITNEEALGKYKNKLSCECFQFCINKNSNYPDYLLFPVVASLVVVTSL